MTKHALEDKDCDIQCNEQGQELTCGGSNAYSVYATPATVAGKC